MIASAALIPVVPESAPFTSEQRAWLNGFFAGLFSHTPQTPGAPRPVAVPVEEETFPWHDPALAIDERLKLAEGKPKERLLMAAMAQLDCGACGYQCQTYAQAIARGEEADLCRCAPGGKETSRKLKQLMAAEAAAPLQPPPQEKTPAPPAIDRRQIYSVGLHKSEILNSPGSNKETRLVSLDLAGSGLTYLAGDALGIYPENCPDVVQWLLERLDAGGAEEVAAPNRTTVSLFDALLKHYEISKPTETLIELLARCATDFAQRDLLTRLLNDDAVLPDDQEIIDLLMRAPSSKPPIGEFIAALRPLQPRLYSISSSQRVTPHEVHLTVGVVRYLNSRQRQCKGVASTYLAERLRPGQKVRVFVQTAHAFRPPANDDTPMIMVGPGTGIAPFRAFLQERQALGAKGRNWLFFGDQRAEFDYLYRGELEAFRRAGILTHLETAFSRDQAEKVYVQTRVIQRGREIWDWLQAGSHFYVCGDAKRMAAEVDIALRTIIADHGKMTADAAKAYTGELSRAGRYQRDVY